jgi:hypothetical protein
MFDDVYVIVSCWFISNNMFGRNGCRVFHYLCRRKYHGVGCSNNDYSADNNSSQQRFSLWQLPIAGHIGESVGTNGNTRESISSGERSCSNPTDFVRI